MASTEILFFLIGLLRLHFCVSSEDEFKDYEMAGLRESNRHRAFHNVTALRMTKQDNKMAGEWAKKSIESGFPIRFGATPDAGYLDTFYTTNYKVPIDDRDTYSHVLAAIDQWYSQCYRFNFDDTFEYTEKTREFAIMVSPEQRYFGVGVARDKKHIVIVGFYSSNCQGSKTEVPRQVTTCGSARQHLLHLMPILLLQVAILTSAVA